MSRMKQITVRNVDRDLAAALEREGRERHQSINQTVLDLLRRALGLQTDRSYSNGLRRHAGTWSEEDLREFNATTTDFDRIDEADWRP